MVTNECLEDYDGKGYRKIKKGSRISTPFKTTIHILDLFKQMLVFLFS